MNAEQDIASYAWPTTTRCPALIADHGPLRCTRPARHDGGHVYTASDAAQIRDTEAKE